jgi:hypothetical protein
MSNRRWLFSSALLPFLGVPVSAQPVISARAGLIQYTDGVVFLDSTVLRPTPGRFDQMKEGSELRTLTGRAELILTPGVFLRMGEDSAIRMLSNDLADARVRFVSGNAIVDATNLAPKTSIAILRGEYQVQIVEEGRFRFNSDPAELRVESGKALVLYDGNSLEVGAKHVLPFSGKLTARVIEPARKDGLDTWDQTRSDSVAESNQQAANTQDLSTAIDNWQNDPTSALAASGMSGYLPPPGYIPTAPYTTWLSNPYTPLTPLAGLNPWGYGYGYGFGGIYGVYGVPLYRSSLVPRFPLTTGSIYRYPASSFHPVAPYTGRIGVSRSPVFGARPTVAPAPIHVAPHVGGHR